MQGGSVGKRLYCIKMQTFVLQDVHDFPSGLIVRRVGSNQVFALQREIGKVNPSKGHQFKRFYKIESLQQTSSPGLIQVTNLHFVPKNEKYKGNSESLKLRSLLP